MTFQVPHSFLENCGIVEDDIPESLKKLDCKQLKFIIRDFHPDRVEVNEANINKCHYLNELLNSMKQLEQIKRRYIDATKMNQEYEERFRSAQNRIHRLISNPMQQESHTGVLSENENEVVEDENEVVNDENEVEDGKRAEDGHQVEYGIEVSFEDQDAVTVPQAANSEGMADNVIDRSHSLYCRMQRKPRGRPRRGFHWIGGKEWGCYMRLPC